MSQQKTRNVQEKMTELSAMVAWFQSDEFVLEEASQRFQAAEALAKEIEKDLAELKNDITVLADRFDADAR